MRVSTRQENENKKKTSVPRSLNHRESQKSFNWICLYGPSFNSCTVIFSFLFSLFSSKSLKSPWVQLTQLIIPLRQKRAPSNGYGKEWRSWYLQKRFLISQSCVRNANGDSFAFSTFLEQLDKKREGIYEKGFTKDSTQPHNHRRIAKRLVTKPSIISEEKKKKKSVICSGL